LRLTPGAKYPYGGTPQGGCVSPILANIYLHEVLDEWLTRQVAPLVAHAHLVHYADDAVIIFAQERDAQRVFDGICRKRDRCFT